MKNQALNETPVNLWHLFRVITSFMPLLSRIIGKRSNIMWMWAFLWEQKIIRDPGLRGRESTAENMVPKSSSLVIFSVPNWGAQGRKVNIKKSQQQLKEMGECLPETYFWTTLSTFSIFSSPHYLYSMAQYPAYTLNNMSKNKFYFVFVPLFAVFPSFYRIFRLSSFWAISLPKITFWGIPTSYKSLLCTGSLAPSLTFFEYLVRLKVRSWWKYEHGSGMTIALHVWLKMLLDNLHKDQSHFSTFQLLKKSINKHMYLYCVRNTSSVWWKINLHISWLYLPIGISDI